MTKQVLEIMYELGTKFCHKCSTVKSETAFGKDKHRSDGLTTRCKDCRNKANIEYFSKHPEVREKHNIRNRGKRKKYYADPERKLKYRSEELKRRLGVTHNDYEIMLKDQNGVCKICKRFRIASNKGHMVVDHCHKTGRIRGVLCNWCNRGIGLFEDNLEYLENAKLYLKEI